jgi:hypothetical protein
MDKRNSGNVHPVKTIISFLVRLMIYSAFVVAYYFLVLLSLQGWLKQTFGAHKTIYALVALPLIVAQAVLLDCVTMALRKLGNGKSK